MAPHAPAPTQSPSDAHTDTNKKSPPKQPSPPKTQSTSSHLKPVQNGPQKKPNRSSKPIINWFQRKLGGSVRAKREGGQLSNGTGRVSKTQRVGNRATSSPIPSPSVSGGRQQMKLEALAAARRKTVSLNGDDDSQLIRHSEDEVNSMNESLARESTWSPNSVQEADEDASLRPLPPSAPPSPSPSRSSSSYLSDPRTFKSIAASTKPTTLLSIDLHGNGMAHIAQAPVTPTSQVTRFTHVRSSSTATNSNQLGFSAAPPSPQSSSRPPSLQDPTNTQMSSLIVQAPLHTTHHPRNNPRPLSPPPDDASVLTLASSAYAFTGLRVGGPGAAGWSSPPSAIGGGGDSVSHFGGNSADAEDASQIDDEKLDDRDADASVRALRPRSTRRGSWESEASRWSARIQVTSAPSLGRERSLWTTNSIMTGTFSADDVEVDDKPDDLADDDATGEANAENAEGEAETKVTEDISKLDGTPEESVDIISHNDHDSESKPSKADEDSTNSEITAAAEEAPAPVASIERQTSSMTISHPVEKADGSADPGPTEKEKN
ncbi:hypothetical protein VNI00_005719 [Paramarasmius palmivorus]|uniref:Uncharacterized protein n=1 Tax=Paramarasmius palmivorus TaxID=297713 RepID=A0AAW0DEU0_9AGAR